MTGVQKTQRRPPPPLDWSVFVIASPQSDIIRFEPMQWSTHAVLLISIGTGAILLITELHRLAERVARLERQEADLLTTVDHEVARRRHRSRRRH